MYHFIYCIYSKVTVNMIDALLVRVLENMSPLPLALQRKIWVPNHTGTQQVFHACSACHHTSASSVLIKRWRKNLIFNLLGSSIELLQPPGWPLHGALAAVFLVNLDEFETFGVAGGPFKVVQQRPSEVAVHICSQAGTNGCNANASIIIIILIESCATYK